MEVDKENENPDEYTNEQQLGDDVEEEKKQDDRRPEITLENDYETPMTVRPPSEELNEEEKIFCVSKYFRIFNYEDIVPGEWDNLQDSTHGYEKILALLGKPTFLRKWCAGVMKTPFYSSILSLARAECITNVKLFILLLLKTMAIMDSMICINTCDNVIKSIMSKQENPLSITFNSDEIYMLIFNYGCDVENFQFLNWGSVKQSLNIGFLHNIKPDRIPDGWCYNLSRLLEILIYIISNCNFENECMQKIILIFMWIHRDPVLLKENVTSTVAECIHVSLVKIEEEKWNETQYYIIKRVLAYMSSTAAEKWSTTYKMINAIPNRSRGVELQKHLSFASIKAMLEINDPFDENSLGFSISDLKFVISEIVEINDEIHMYAIKLLSNCLKQLNSSKEEYIELCQALQKCEYAFADKPESFQARKQISFMLARLMVLCGEKVPLQLKVKVWSNCLIKSESEDFYNFNRSANNVFSSENNNEVSIKEECDDLDSEATTSVSEPTDIENQKYSVIHYEDLIKIEPIDDYENIIVDVPEKSQEFSAPAVKSKNLYSKIYIEGSIKYEPVDYDFAAEIPSTSNNKRASHENVVDVPKKIAKINLLEESKSMHLEKTSSLDDINLSTEQGNSSSTSDHQNTVDDDIIHLYVDPKTYKDKECLIVYENEDIVVIDSD